MVNFIEIREWRGRHFEPRTVVVHPNHPRFFLLILAKPASKKEVEILDNSRLQQKLICVDVVSHFAHQSF